ncbi:exported protease [Kutzneria sp. CA-103260]|nr:exported protease [Kutzneria sp. CA-103260]
MLLAVTALAAGGCTAVFGGQPEAGVTFEKAGPAGSVPAGLEKFYGQQLGWGSCDSYATSEQDKKTFAASPDLKCARLTVPLDYAKPDGRTITLGLLRRKATDPSQRIGSLLINPGGPGASGISAAASLSSAVAGNDLGKRFDLVGFDPRGIGSSEPAVHCLTDAERDKQRADDIEDTSAAGVAKEVAQLKDYTAKCAQRSGADLLANVGTRDVAKDLDVMRSALGDKKLSYLGFSYGTFLGTTYAEQFPANVRALVLDGAVDPTQSPTDAEVAQSAGFQKAFDQFAAWCVQRQDCALGKDAGKAVQAYHDLVVPLINHPVDTGDNRKLTFADATTATIQALYTQQLWETLNSGLVQLKRGLGLTLMAMADLYDGRGEDGKYSNEQDAFTAIQCVDNPQSNDQAAELDAERRSTAAAPFLDNGQPMPTSAAGDACAYWPVPNTSQPHLPQVSGLPATLVVSTTNDPATPYQAGVNLAHALGGFLLTYQSTQHTAFLQGSECVDQVGVDYLVNLKLPAADPRCSS